MPDPTYGALRNVIERSDWRQTLVTDYEDTAARLLTAYERTLPRLQETVDQFTQRVNAWVAANPDQPLTAANVRGFQQYQDLLARVELETRDFAALLRNEAGLLQDKAVVTGTAAAEDLAAATAGNQIELIVGGWNRPAPEALTTLIGYVDGEAFRRTTAQFGENAAANIGDVILTSVAQGKNPRTLAAILSNWLAVPYAWAENSARTLQLWSYRSAAQITYAANADVLDGWVWTATLDGRVCMSCVAQHGTVYPLNKTLNDHHRGRCTPVPLVKGTRWHQNMQTGAAWFESLPEAQQQAQMGPSLWGAWNAGAVGWQDMSRPYNNDVFGEMLGQPSLKSLLGSEAKVYYSYGG